MMTIDAPSYTTIGNGNPVILLHGGPGDNYGYLMPLAEGLSTTYRCILYNQKGSGETPAPQHKEFTVTTLIEELEALRMELQLPKLTLIGHSWGATFALMYAATYPEYVEKMILIGMGPLNDQWKEIVRANTLRPLNDYERAAHQTAQFLRDEAIEAQDWPTVNAIVKELVTKFYLKSWFYDQTAAQRYVDILDTAAPLNHLAWRSINRSLDQAWLQERLPSIHIPTLVMYGYQDFEPITQVYTLKDHLANVTIALINRAAHFPWMEQPEAVFAAITNFLGS